VSGRRRAAPSAPSFTSLLDVLFILVFAALVRTASLQEAAAEQDEAAPTPVVPAPPQPPAGEERADLQRRALAHFDASLRARRIVIARVGADGMVTAVEDGARKLPTSVPLLARVADVNVGLIYLGEQSRELRICSIVRQQLGATDLKDVLVIAVPAAPLDGLPVALVDGLRRDEQRCAIDLNGLAVLLDPAEAPKTNGQGTP
jgi:hypothetical protein